MEYNIALIKGDGIGPEISDETVKILEIIGKLYNHRFNIKEVIGAGEAVDKYGEPLPKKSLKICLQSDAIIIGNIGGKKWDSVSMDKKPVKSILDLRKALNVSSNLRPITINKNLMEFSPLKESIISKGIDILVVRDLLGSVICGEKKYELGSYGREASDLEYYNEKIIKKSGKIAFDLALKRRSKVACIDKSNVLSSSRLWKEIIKEESINYPKVTLTNHLVDAAAMEVISSPHLFDVIVTSNMFGDILADELSQITGTACMLPSAEINEGGKGIFTPNQLHHPDETIIGKNKANPIGLISSAALMLKYSFGLEEEPQLIENAIDEVIERGYRTEDIYKEGNIIIKTDEMGNLISNYIIEIFEQNKRLKNNKLEGGNV